MDHDYLKYRSLKKDDIVLILGAYDGDFMREKKDEIVEKNVFVINIEPDTRLFRKCFDFVVSELPNNAVVLNMAVYNVNSIVQFHQKHFHQLSTLKHVQTQWHDITELETNVLTITLDALISLYRINCIFCDIEGAELEVFSDSQFMSEVDYIAIAAYHKRDGIETYHTLKEKFDNNIFLDMKKIIIDVDDSKPDGTLLYIMERDK